MSKESRAAFNGSVGEARPPTVVKLDDLDGRPIAERIEQLQARIFCTDYRMAARATSPAWRTVGEAAPITETESA